MSKKQSRQREEDVAKTLMGFEKCLNCRGTGKVWVSFYKDPPRSRVLKKCKYCSGEGWINKDQEVTLDFSTAELIALSQIKNKKRTR